MFVWTALILSFFGIRKQFSALKKAAAGIKSRSPARAGRFRVQSAQVPYSGRNREASASAPENSCVHLYQPSPFSHFPLQPSAFNHRRERLQPFVSLANLFDRDGGEEGGASSTKASAASVPVEQTQTTENISPDLELQPVEDEAESAQGLVSLIQPQNDQRVKEKEKESSEQIETSHRLNMDRAVEAAGFSFEVYTDPKEGEGVWSEDSDGNLLAYLSPNFVRDVFQGLLEVRVIGAKGLPLIANPYVKLNLDSIIDQTESQGLVVGGNAQWGGTQGNKEGEGGEDESDGEVFYFYVRDFETQSLDFDIWSSSLTGLFQKRLGLARCPLRDLTAIQSKGEIEGSGNEMVKLSLPVSGDDVGAESALEIGLRWHAFSKAETELFEGLPPNIHDVTASGLKGLAVKPAGNVRKMDTASLVALLRAWGLRTRGHSKEELIQKAELAMQLRENDATRILQSVGRVVGKNNTILMSSLFQNAVSILNKGSSMLKGDTVGAIQEAVNVVSREFTLEELKRSNTDLSAPVGSLFKMVKGVMEGAPPDFSNKSLDLPFVDSFNFQNRLERVREKAQKAAMVRLATGMGLTSNKEGSAWKMLLESVTSKERARRGNYELCTFIENQETDSQAYVYRSKEDSIVWVAFRGTEQDSWRDILTDIMVTPREPEFAKEPIMGTLSLRDIEVSGVDDFKGDSFSVRLSDQYMIPIFDETPQIAGRGLRFEEPLQATLRSEDPVRLTLFRHEGDNEYEVGSMLIKATPENAMWYPIGGRHPAKIRFKSEFERLRSSENNVASTDEEKPQVHSGFLRAYKSTRKRVIDTVEQAISVSPEKEWRVYVTGHSLGGALATLMSYELATYYQKRKDIAKDVKVKMYNFGSPRVGNAAFAKNYDDTVPESWRIYNSKDVISTVPRMMSYSHVKTGVMIDSAADALRLGATSSQDQGVGEDVDDYVEFTTNNLHKLTPADVLPSLSKLYDSEIERLRTLADGTAISDHMEDLYFFALQRVILRELVNDRQ